MEKHLEKWQSKINEIVLGAGDLSVKIGGQNALPFIYEEGVIPNFPKVAIEISDVAPEHWPAPLKREWQDVFNDPVKWAVKCQDLGAEFLCIRLTGAHPEGKNKSAEEVAKTVKNIADSIEIPIIVLGCESTQKNTEVLPTVSASIKGKNALVGMATKDNYKTIAISALADGHSIIAETPLDINLAKQLNILIADTGFSTEKIVMHQTTGALGYGYEYCYTIMERTRLAGLSGDKMMSMPMINFVGVECWKLKESITTNEEMPSWGDFEKRGIFWEICCGSGYLESGADIVVVYHPESLKTLKKIISDLSKKTL